MRERPDAYRAIQVLCEKNRARQKEWAVQVREEVVLRVVTGELLQVTIDYCSKLINGRWATQYRSTTLYAGLLNLASTLYTVQKRRLRHVRQYSEVSHC